MRHLLEWKPGRRTPILALALFLIPAGFSAGQAQERAFFQESWVVRSSAFIPECTNPHLSSLADGTLLCVWASGSGPGALDTSLKISTRKAGGWSAPRSVVDVVGLAESYPVLARMPDDRLRVFYATFYKDKRKNPPTGESLASWHLEYTESADGGETWGGRFFLIPESNLVPTGRVLLATDGTLWLPVNNLDKGNSLLLTSGDGGGYWKASVGAGFPIGLVDPALAEWTPGRLLAVLRPHPGSGRAHSLFRSESSAGRLEWSPPESMSMPNPCGSIDLIVLRNGHLVLAHNLHERWLTPLTLSLSTDGGKTWQHSRDLVTGQWDNRDPSLTQTDDGHIHVVYVYRDIHVMHVEVNEAWIMEEE